MDSESGSIYGNCSDMDGSSIGSGGYTRYTLCIAKGVQEEYNNNTCNSLHGGYRDIDSDRYSMFDDLRRDPSAEPYMYSIDLLIPLSASAAAAVYDALTIEHRMRPSFVLLSP